MKKNAADFGQRIWRGMFALAMTVGLASGITVATAAPAQAWGSYTYYYSVEGYKVCQSQGHTGASSINWFDPYSMYCYDLSVPAGITFSGNLDIQKYCSDKYPGSTAVVDGKTIFDWKCKRKEWRP